MPYRARPAVERYEWLQGTVRLLIGKFDASEGIGPSPETTLRAPAVVSRSLRLTLTEGTVHRSVYFFDRNRPAANSDAAEEDALAVLSDVVEVGCVKFAVVSKVCHVRDSLSRFSERIVAAF